MSLLNHSTLPVCKMERVICHWSEGHHRANSTDLEHYHLLIEGDGKVVFGDHSIADNANTSDDDYAAHTFHCNNRSIGVACCCMVGTNETPFRPGSEPLTTLQWDTMCQVVAELCAFYQIPVTPRTVLGHGEVQANLGIIQKGKWDPMVLPFDLAKTRAQVGEALRAGVSERLAGLPGGIFAPEFPSSNGHAAAPVGGEGTSPSFLAGMVTVAGSATAHLRSSLFRGNVDLEEVAAGNRLLRTGANPQPGIDRVQDALNRLAAHGGDYRVDFGPTGGGRGRFGQRTQRAVINFQRDLRLGVDGKVGEETIVALDEALLRLEGGQRALPPADVHSAVPAAGNYAPPPASATVLAGLDFARATSESGRRLFNTYAAADQDVGLAKGDPSNCPALLRFPDNTVFFEAKMAICADGSPRARRIDPSSGQPSTAFTFPRVKDGFFDAEEVPYVVLPGRNKDGSLDFTGAFAIQPLDLAVVMVGNRFVPAFYGEVGPWFRLGEAAIKVHEGLPVRSPWTSDRDHNSIRNSSVPGKVLYFVFPGTAVPRRAGMSPADWLKETLRAAERRFAQFRESGGTQVAAPSPTRAAAPAGAGGGTPSPIREGAPKLVNV